MHVSNVSSVTNANSGVAQAGSVQRAQDLQMLESALGSGSLSKAQNAFATFQQHLQSLTAAGAQAFSANSPAGKDFEALQSALQSGNLAVAKSAFASFRQDLQGAGPSPQYGTTTSHLHRGAHIANMASASPAALAQGGMDVRA